jgi:putative proteasome-type protease
MTYCLGMLLDAGLVLIADTRTNAGIDNIATFRKLHVFNRPNDRVIALASSGNLSLSQSVVSLLAEGLPTPEGPPRTLLGVGSMFEAALLVGEAVREVYRTEGQALETQKMSFDVMFLLGGQISDRRLRLFQVYSAGNFIEATADTPYLQVGEHKYGKPILDRSVSFDTDVLDALKLGLISMDSTLRSNLSVGLPIDVLLYRAGTLEARCFRIEPEEPYFRDLRDRWSKALRAAHVAIPRPPWIE